MRSEVLPGGNGCFEGIDPDNGIRYRGVVSAMSTAHKRANEFERLALPHLRSLMGMARRLTDSSADAEDLVQDTYLRAWRSFHRFRSGSNCKAWLFRILLNTSHRRHRRIADRQRTVSLDEAEAPASGMEEPLQACSAREILAAIEKMPAEHRIVLVLAVVEGFTCQEIAAIQNWPPGTVMSRLHRARLNLRRRLMQPSHSPGNSNPVQL